MSHMHDTYHADDQANRFTDDKDQCDGKGVDSSTHPCYANKLGDRV